jgi:glutamate-ammonia-ligase adenylyltransferase
MNCADLDEFEKALELHTKNVNLIFSRVFQEGEFEQSQSRRNTENTPAVFYQNLPSAQSGLNTIFSSLEKSDAEIDVSDKTLETLKLLSETSPHFAEMIASNPNLIRNLPTSKDELNEQNYREIFLSAVGRESNYKNELAVLRKIWSRFLLEIVVFDIFEKIPRQKAKRLQTNLAEASIETALFITRRELERRFSVEVDEFPFAVLGLGKLGGGGMDYGSDLDLILIYDDEKSVLVKDSSHTEFYSRAVEIFVTVLSSLTRDGHLYRVDLRLRPDGKNGATSTSKTAFLNYLETRAAIWEWLAYVKLRGVAGCLKLAKETEFAARKIIHQNAQQLKIQDLEFKTLREEIWRIRERLETEKAGGRRGKEIDIKFGAGGMLDVYFAVRFLQLRANVPDDAETRTTDFMLKKLFESEFLEKEPFENFSNGYAFLSELDHNLRLTVGRSSQLPLANQTALQTIVKRMKLESIKDLLEQLTFHRLNIRAAFEAILKS